MSHRQSSKQSLEKTDCSILSPLIELHILLQLLAIVFALELELLHLQILLLNAVDSVRNILLLHQKVAEPLLLLRRVRASELIVLRVLLNVLLLRDLLEHFLRVVADLDFGALALRVVVQEARGGVLLQDVELGVPLDQAVQLAVLPMFALHGGKDYSAFCLRNLCCTIVLFHTNNNKNIRNVL